MDAQSQLPQGSESATAKGSIDASQQPSSTPSDECSAGAEEVTCAGIPAGAFAKLSEHQKTCWKNEASLTPEQRRARYYYSDFTKVEDLKQASSGKDDKEASESGTFFSKASLRNKLCVWRGQITALEIDAIVNAANTGLLGGGGVDGAIHRAAGKALLNECAKLGGCDTGSAKITRGYNLPAKYVIHAVGPVGEKPDLLASCYTTCLDLAKEYNIRTIAFPGISTGVYGYPVLRACKVAFETTRDWLTKSKENFDALDLIVFVVYEPRQHPQYERVLYEVLS